MKSGNLVLYMASLIMLCVCPHSQWLIMILVSPVVTIIVRVLESCMAVCQHVIDVTLVSQLLHPLNKSGVQLMSGNDVI